MRPWLAPSLMVDNLWDLDLDRLSEEGIRGIILDLDNTLVDWNAVYVRPEVHRWLAAAREKGMKLCLVSNSVRGGRVRRMGEELKLAVVTRACKPFPVAFRRAMETMGTRPESTCAVGDQVFTDMLGANRLGLTTVLVTPLSRRESPHTRLIRLLEAPLRRRWARRGRGEKTPPEPRGG